jgi:hypothetical protein
MIGIHGICGLTAKTSTSVDSNWVSLTLTATDGTSTELTLYFATRRPDFAEEHRYAMELAAAINGLKPIDVGNWGDARPEVPCRDESTAEEAPEYPADHPAPGDLGSIPL